MPKIQLFFAVLLAITIPAKPLFADVSCLKAAFFIAAAFTPKGSTQEVGAGVGVVYQVQNGSGTGTIVSGSNIGVGVGSGSTLITSATGAVQNYSVTGNIKKTPKAFYASGTSTLFVPQQQISVPVFIEVYSKNMKLVTTKNNKKKLTGKVGFRVTNQLTGAVVIEQPLKKFSRKQAVQYRWQQVRGLCVLNGGAGGGVKR